MVVQVPRVDKNNYPGGVPEQKSPIQIGLGGAGPHLLGKWTARVSVSCMSIRRG